MGHMGIECTLDLVRTRFYWPKMAMDVEQKIKSCGRCVRRKALPERAAPLVSIKTSRPLELLCMDFLSLEPDSSNTRNILVLTDHFTKFTVAIPTPNQKAKTVAKCLWENFITYYGIPERIHTDQGQDFESKLIKELCDFAGIVKSRTTPYHPRGNPVERFNRTLLSMLGTLETKQKTRWKEHVKPLVHAYNCTRNEVTGYTPYELMFGRTPRLPVDLVFDLPLRETKQTSHSQYVKSLKTRLEESFKVASSNAAKSADRNKSRFDSRVIPSALEPGDRVLVRNVRLRGKHKLSDKWEEQVYVVVHRAGNLPVYKVKPEHGDGPARTLHRDLLLPCSFLTDSDNLPENSPVRRPRTRQQRNMQNPSIELTSVDDDTESVVSVMVNPSTLHFTVENQHPALGSPPLNENERPSTSVSDPPVSTEEQRQPTSPMSDTLPSVSKSNSEHPESNVEENLPEHGVSNVLEEQSEPENLNLPESAENLNLPESAENLNLPESAEDLNLPESAELNLSESEGKLTGVAISIEDLPLSNPVEIPANNPPAVDPSRRSHRQRFPPNRLQYSTLGNPLINVVQTMLHSLSDALGITISSSTPSSVHVI
ncbi:uncharacterized protein LOC127533369 [Acanthochromis polyacanthus]|uniref:uncharacterized protein LOC127533369 n=1 Tax=Acanthochromis polyacanthus TaxID=80966 RepID=UPI0022345F20|nr:uncharacterized protein LOC127533369 [Acanthochromis polyacanthus]